MYKQEICYIAHPWWLPPIFYLRNNTLKHLPAHEVSSSRYVVIKHSDIEDPALAIVQV